MHGVTHSQQYEKEFSSNCSL